MKNINYKLYSNSLITERLIRLNKEEKQQIINQLLINKSERELAKELGIPHSTIHDWKTLRQNNTKEKTHVSLSMIARKLDNFKITKPSERLYLLRIKKLVDGLLGE